mgnify:CR=1 FL=1
MRNFKILLYQKILNYLQVNCQKKFRGHQEQLRHSGVLRHQHVQQHQGVLRVLLQRRHNQIKLFKKKLKMRHFWKIFKHCVSIQILCKASSTPFLWSTINKSCMYACYITYFFTRLSEIWQPNYQATQKAWIMVLHGVTRINHISPRKWLSKPTKKNQIENSK